MNEVLIIIAASGRLIAQSAHRASRKLVVIDLFADVDTDNYAASIRVKTLAKTDLKTALQQANIHVQNCSILFGSGLEQYPDSLALLHETGLVYGNSLQTCLQLSDKAYFFQVLKKLKIPYPNVSFEFNIALKNGLFKAHAGFGGNHVVKKLDGQQFSQMAYYWQQQIEGDVLSVLFLGNGRNSRVIGYNRQWCKPDSFVFKGIETFAHAVPNTLKVLIEQCVKQLTSAFTLQGLNSLDFIWDGSVFYVLEINPRPSASLALYDSCFPRGLIFAHIEACQGRLSEIDFDLPAFNAMQIVFAEQTVKIPTDIDWPDWVSDIPQNQQTLLAGQPICSIMAHAESEHALHVKLSTYENILYQLLTGKSNEIQ